MDSPNKNREQSSHLLPKERQVEKTTSDLVFNTPRRPTAGAELGFPMAGILAFLSHSKPFISWDKQHRSGLETVHLLAVLKDTELCFAFPWVVLFSSLPATESGESAHSPDKGPERTLGDKQACVWNGQADSRIPRASSRAGSSSIWQFTNKWTLPQGLSLADLKSWPLYHRGVPWHQVDDKNENVCVKQLQAKY